MESTGKRVLVVDDDEGFRYTAERALTSAGYEVVAAPDYRLALEKLEEEQIFDLLLTDILMPDRIHGFALARMARMRISNSDARRTTAAASKRASRWRY